MRHGKANTVVVVARLLTVMFGAIPPANAASVEALAPTNVRCHTIRADFMLVMREWTTGDASSKKTDQKLKGLTVRVDDSQTKSLMLQIRFGVQDGEVGDDLQPLVANRLNNGYC